MLEFGKNLRSTFFVCVTHTRRGRLDSVVPRSSCVSTPSHKALHNRQQKQRQQQQKKKSHLFVLGVNRWAAFFFFIVVDVVDATFRQEIVPRR